MPRPKKTTVRNESGQTSTPDVKVVANERAQIEALNIAVADLQNRVRMLEARQNPNPFASMDAMLASARAASPIPMPGLPVFGQPHPMYARMGATPVPNQMVTPCPQPMYLEPKLKNPETVNMIMTTDVRMLGFTASQILWLQLHDIFVIGKLIAVVTGVDRDKQLELKEAEVLHEKAFAIVDWLLKFIEVTPPVLIAADYANVKLRGELKKGAADHGDHVRSQDQ